MKKETLRKGPGGITAELHAVIQYAQKCHVDTNHSYDGSPYYFHLEGVYVIAKRFIHLFPEDQHHTLLAAAWCHDLIEDTRQTFNDVKMMVGENVANIVYALTNEKGRNRKERANAKYYDEMKKVPGAVFVKLCDRLANIIHSSNRQSSMLQAYRKEQDFFKEMLFDRNYMDIWYEMEQYLTK